MILLKNDRIVNVDTSEDTLRSMTIVKSLEQLKKEHPNSTYHVQDCVGTIKCRYGENMSCCYYGMREQSEYNDGSGMDTGIVGGHPTKGEFILACWKYNYRVFVKKEDKWIELTKDGPKELPLDVKLYYTKEKELVEAL